TALKRELAEALEQQAATSEVLRVISSSPGELQSVFEAILANATRLCGAKFGTLYLRDGDAFRATAFHNAPPAFIDHRKRAPLRPGPDTSLGQAARTKQVAHVVDSMERDSYRRRDPFVVAGAELGGYRTIVSVPMLKEDKLVGVISIYRQEVRPFSEKQIALVTSFAAQAVIAIENTRLLNELRQRTTDLSEALEQQTATSEVLRVISSSPGDLQPVFSTMLGNAVRICEAKFGTLYLCEGDGFRALAMHNAPPAYAEARAAVVRPPPDSSLGRAAKTKEPAQVADVTKLPAYIAGDPFLVSAVAHGGYRTVLTVPMLKEDELIGAISIYCQEVRPFSDKQIELVTSFARQAVIAIENTRLLNELRQRTTDLSEALEQQTATSEVLRVISSFPGELEPVFQAMLDNAVRICEAKFGILFRYVDEAFEAVALFGVPPAYAADLQSGLRRPNPGTGLGRLAKTRRAVHIRDLCAEQAYRKRDPIRVATVEKGGAGSFLAVPMLKDNDLIGAIVIYRQEVRPFTQKQVELLTNFAAQAVIAIENTRLLNELRQRTTDLGEALEQRTATSQVLEVISSSPGELEPVFTALLDNAVRLCGARFGLLYLCEGDIFRIGGAHNVPPTLVEIRKRGPFRPIPGGPVSEAARTKRPAQAADLAATSAYAERHPQSVAAVELGGVRSVLAVPMLKN